MTPKIDPNWPLRKKRRIWLDGSIGILKAMIKAYYEKGISPDDSGALINDAQNLIQQVEASGWKPGDTTGEK